MIALILALAGTANYAIPPFLFNCQVTDLEGQRRPLGLLYHGPKSGTFELHDPSSVLNPPGGVVGINDSWPRSWELVVSPFRGYGPHGENLGMWDGWVARIEPRPNSKAEAEIVIERFDAKMVSNERPNEPNLIAKGDCNWSKGRAARVAYKRLVK